MFAGAGIGRMLGHAALGLCWFTAPLAASAQDDAVGRAFSVFARGFGELPYESASSRAFNLYVGPDAVSTPPVTSASSRSFTVFTGTGAGADPVISSASARNFTAFAGDDNDIYKVRSVSSQAFTVYVPQPDLEVTLVRPTGVVEPGETFEMSWGVRNNGPRAADAAWHDCFFLSTSSEWAPNALEISCTPSVRALAAGEGYASSAEITFPDVSTGIYWLHFRADGDGVIGEDVESNNFESYGPFGINRDGEPVRILPQLETIFVALNGGSDETGYGTEDLPLRRLAFALAHAATYARADRPVRVQIAAGEYDDAFTIPSHVKLFGSNPFDPGETVIRPTGAKLKGNGGVAINIGPGADGSAVRNLTLKLDESAKGLDNATLLAVDDARATIDNVVFDGAEVPSSTGMLAQNPGSSDGAVTRCVFQGLTVGIEVGDSGINISRNTFDGINGDAIVVTGGDKGAEEPLTPMMGSEGDQGATGYNYFGEISGLLLNNQSGMEVKAEMNDWGVYTSEDISAGMVGAIDYVPFLGQTFFAASVFVSVINDLTSMPVFNATVQMQPGAWPEIEENVDGVYAISLVSPGQYTIGASAPGYFSSDATVSIDTSNPVVEVFVALPPDGTGGGGVPPVHHGDTDGSGDIDLSEILRGIQLYNAAGIRCMAGTEDGYAPGLGDTSTCLPHVGDYNPPDWRLSLSEVLRLLQIYNLRAYERCEDGEDGYCPGD